MTFLSKGFWMSWTCYKTLSSLEPLLCRRYVVWDDDVRWMSCHNRLHRPVIPVSRHRLTSQQGEKCAVDKTKQNLSLIGWQTDVEPVCSWPLQTARPFTTQKPMLCNRPFDILKQGLTARSRGQKQRKLKEHSRVIFSAFGLVTNQIVVSEGKRKKDT